MPTTMPERAWRGMGDVDILATSHQGDVVVLEVKSRLIPRILYRHGPKATRLALQYHLDEPGRALKAWNTLSRHRREELLDSPASIAELARAGIAVARGLIGNNLGPSESLIIGALLPFYAEPFIPHVAEYTARTAMWLGECLEVPVWNIILLLRPLGLGLPSRARLECVTGDACQLLGVGSVEVEVKLLPGYNGCSECRYKGFCRNVYSKRTTIQY